MLMTIVTSHDWNVLHSEAEPCEGWTDEEAYACDWFIGTWIFARKNSWARLSKLASKQLKS